MGVGGRPGAVAQFHGPTVGAGVGPRPPAAPRGGPGSGGPRRADPQQDPDRPARVERRLSAGHSADRPDRALAGGRPLGEPSPAAAAFADAGRDGGLEG
jgi:hypothetical protein